MRMFVCRTVQTHLKCHLVAASCTFLRRCCTSYSPSFLHLRLLPLSPSLVCPHPWYSPGPCVSLLLSLPACAHMRGVVKIIVIYNGSHYKHVRKQHHGDGAQTKSQCGRVFIRSAWPAESASPCVCVRVSVCVLCSCG